MKMKITYIYHSGFLVETKECYYLFDYYKGSLPSLDENKQILVFASHSHRDHYNKEVFSLLKNMGIKHVTAVLAKDISPKLYPDDVAIQKVTFHETYELPCNTILRTLHSTDAGVAFLVQCPEGNIYHAGDLNDWVWEGESEQYNRQRTGNYRHEIELLNTYLKENDKDSTLDVAFLPLDPRQEQDYAKGMLYFLKKINVRHIYPMHYWNKPQVINRFLREYTEYSDIIMQTENANLV